MVCMRDRYMERHREIVSDRDRERNRERKVLMTIY